MFLIWCHWFNDFFPLQMPPLPVARAQRCGWKPRPPHLEAKQVATRTVPASHSATPNYVYCHVLYWETERPVILFFLPYTMHNLLFLCAIHFMCLRTSLFKKTMLYNNIVRLTCLCHLYYYSGTSKWMSTLGWHFAQFREVYSPLCRGNKMYYSYGHVRRQESFAMRFQ